MKQACGKLQSLTCIRSVPWLPDTTACTELYVVALSTPPLSPSHSSPFTPLPPLRLSGTGAFFTMALTCPINAFCILHPDPDPRSAFFTLPLPLHPCLPPQGTGAFFTMALTCPVSAFCILHLPLPPRHMCQCHPAAASPPVPHSRHRCVLHHGLDLPRQRLLHPTGRDGPFRAATVTPGGEDWSETTAVQKHRLQTTSHTPVPY